MRISKIPIFCLLSFPVMGQVAIIQNIDGFAYARTERDNHASVLHRLTENEAFFYEDKDMQREDGWISVHINDKDAFTSPDVVYAEGFVHKSRLLPLTQLPVYKGSALQFRYDLQKFDPSRHQIVYAKKKHIKTIDGVVPFGVKGDIPKIEIAGISLVVFGTSVAVPRELYNDLYECTNDVNIYRQGNTFFVVQVSNEATGYQLVWVIMETGVEKRLVLRQ